MALTQDRRGVLYEDIEAIGVAPVAAATQIFLGALISFDAAGNAVNVADAAAQANKLIVLALENVNNTGGAGDKKIKFMTHGTALLPVGSLVAADRGKQVHATDENTLALISTNGRVVGPITDVRGDVAAVRIG